MCRQAISDAKAVQRFFDALESHQLVRRAYFNGKGFGSASVSGPLPSLPTMTDRGRAFLEACQPPKPKSDTFTTITNLINSRPGLLVAGGVLAGIVWKF